MCGFAGVVVWDERYRVSPDTLRKMSAAIAHRGPDGEGYHHTRINEPITPANPQVALAFRRLAILDPDPRSNQPFTDGRRWLVFNGEIYNFRELRKELTALLPDYQWRTTGDTEVLLAAYAAWGEKCVEHLNGMFAFAVWDEAEKTLFLARDRMGQKPLYLARPYCSNPMPILGFASELGAFRTLPWFKVQNQKAIVDYLRWGYQVGGEATIFDDEGKVPPGAWARYANATPADSSYYFSPNEFMPEDRSGPMVRERVQTAIRRQLVADVPLGCFLSGGVDSSVIAACMRSSVPREQPVLTFSIGFDDPRYDETAFAALVASHLGTQHQRFTVHPEAAADLPKLAAALGEPFGDSSVLPTYYLARETRSYVKVALSGDGGDELFGGYDRYRAVKWAKRIFRLPSPARHGLAMATASLPGSHPKSAAVRLKRFAASLVHSPAERYTGYLRFFTDTQITELLADAGSEALTEDYLTTVYGSELQDHDPVTAALAVDRESYLPEDLLTKVDRCSMLHALEVRSPFMDHDLVQFAAGLTTDQLLKGGPKRMLREAFAADLPAWVFKRKKMGFAVPIGDWFRGPLRPMLHDTLFSSHAFARSHFNMNVVQRLVDEHESNRQDHSQRLYALLMLELWWNTVRA